MQVPQLDLQRQFATIRNDVQESVNALFESQYFVLGPTVDKFEKSMAEYLQVHSTVGLASGSEALRVALAVLDVGPGDEVLLPAFTFFATAGAVVHSGATPVFVDIDENYLIDLDDARAVLTDRTKAVIPVHLYGRQVPMAPWRKLADETGLKIIEDAAQSIGSRNEEGCCGGLGDLAAFSFFPSKNLGGAGDGGLLSGNDPELLARARRYRNHGEVKRYHHDEVGINGRLDALQAAVLQAKLPFLEKWNGERRQRARHYNELIASAELQDVITCPELPTAGEHVFHQYTLRAENRDRLLTFLHEREIGAAVYYPVPLHKQRCFQNSAGAERELPVTDMLAREVISLPIYPELTEEQQDWVVTSLREFYRE
jgi:dTDP-4-amino-4,6-dideoxygalactose transaminase